MRKKNVGIAVLISEIEIVSQVSVLSYTSGQSSVQVLTWLADKSFHHRFFERICNSALNASSSKSVLKIFSASFSSFESVHKVFYKSGLKMLVAFIMDMMSENNDLATTVSKKVR